MSLLHGSEGLFHFIFADQQDEYITSSYFSMKFVPYLQMRLVQNEYKYIYVLGSGGKQCTNEYWLSMVGEQSMNLLDNDNGIRGGLITKFLHRHNVNDEKIDRGIRVFEFSKQSMLEKLYSILDIMEQRSSIALSLPIDLFCELGDDKDSEFVRKLTLLKNRRRNNIIIITTSLSAEYNNHFFRFDHLLFPNKPDTNKNSSVFLNNNLFPEIARAFSDEAEFQNRVLLYEVLQDVLKNQMHVWNNLSYEKICNAVKYHFMHSPGISLKSIAYAEQYAHILWMWYNDIDFCDKYYNINFIENTQHSIRLIRDSLDNEKVRNRIEEINYTGAAYDREEISEKSGKIYGNTNDSFFVGILEDYRKILRTHSDILCKEELSELLMIIDYFRKPAFIHKKNSDHPIYTNFSEEKNRVFTRRFLQYLREIKEINQWDAGAAYIFYKLMHYCYKDVSPGYDNDPYHVLCKTIFDMCMKAISYAMKQSSEIPYAQEEAAVFTNDFVNVLKTEDRNSIRIYSIG